MKRLFAVIVLICAAFMPSAAQDEPAEELFYDADFFYTQEEDYEEAAYLFRQLLRKEPDNAHAKFLLGMCYLNILGEEHLAIPYFQEASEKISLNFRANRYTEKNAPHHTWFYLGEAYRINNQLDEALEALDEFQSLKEFEKKYNLRITEEARGAIERAKIIKDAPLEVRMHLYEEPINTTRNDYSGVISGNEEMMVWVRSQAFYEAVMMSTKVNGEWTVPINITPQLRSDGDLFPTGLSMDGTTLLLVKRRRSGSDIWYSQYDGLIWSPAVPLHGEVNSRWVEDHASFNPEGNRIYFSSDRRGSVGGLDIYYSRLQPDGSWGKPVNMGKEINTEKDETSAYVSPDKSRFIFSSRDHFTMGGYDIFRCERQEDGSLGKPVNIGFPINTTGDNTFYVPLGDGMSGIYSRYSVDGLGGQDLWFVQIVPENGVIRTTLPVTGIPGGLSHRDFTIVVVDEQTGEEIEVHYDAGRDTFQVQSGADKNYRVTPYKQQ
ncbi:MAG TPA: tetratricopeptide repeat protein [Bacteroides sp.]|nr:tetratricopeptide repeat protein [Bacteroides sp.]